MAKIKKGDKVVVHRPAATRARTGEVLRVLLDQERVVVQGVSMVKRHTRPGAGQPGGIVDKEGTIHISNVALIDPKSSKPTRVGLQDPGRRQKGARRQALGRGDRRLKHAP